MPVLSGALARAFHDDPVFEWIIDDDAAQLARLPALFAAFTELFLPHQQTYLAGEGAGAVVWAPPGSDPFAGDQGKVFDERMGAALAGDVDRAARLDELLTQHHPKQPCFYLQFVGVGPEHQGRGVGSRLLTTVLERCDATGTPAYLEATSVNDRWLYERHGFETVGEIALPAGPSLWWMCGTGVADAAYADAGALPARPRRSRSRPSVVPFT